MEKSAHGVVGEINLVRKRGTSIDTFLQWALTTGRLIIIITETVALAAFAMRFSLDSQIIDLHDKIKQEKAIVDALQHNEATYRNVQDRLTLIQTLDAQAKQQTSTFFSLFRALPERVDVTSFDFSPDKVQIDITVRDAQDITSCIDSLKQQQSVSAVHVTKINNKVSEGVITATLIASIKK